MGLLDKIKKLNLFAGFSAIDDEFYDELEEALILSDMGMDTTLKAVEELRERVRGEKLKDRDEVRACLRRVLQDMLNVGDTGLALDTRPAVVLFIGVNGVGKTTTIGKLAAGLQGREGKKVLLCAGDTFRAAAADQLTIWSERAGVDIVKQHEGADPAAVVFDAVTAAKARRVDAMLVDTAGRLHNKQNLMNELNKISRVIDRECPTPAGRPCWCWMPPPGRTASSRPSSSGVRRGHRHRPHQAGRHRQGRYHRRHRQGAGRSREICGYGRGCG